MCVGTKGCVHARPYQNGMMELTPLSNLCEACESQPAVVVEPYDNETQPYRLCEGCHHRLKHRSLRPIEWYRLALRHCPHNYSLHDDFYLDDGTADQPKEDVVDAQLFTAPRLADKAGSLKDLWEFTLTRYALSDELLEAWKKYPAAEILEFLTKAYESREDCHCRSSVLKLAEKCLGLAGADLVRRAWLDYPEKMHFTGLVNASVACLPLEEGFERSFAVFATLPFKEQRTRMMYMSFFKNPKMLDWIESNIQSPVTSNWGNLASSSGIAWERVKRWLLSGRPMSLVALDALIGVAKTAEGGRLHLHEPVKGLPSAEEVEKCLRDYEQTDSAPCVQNSIDYIVENYRFLGPQRT